MTEARRHLDQRHHTANCPVTLLLQQPHSLPQLNPLSLPRLNPKCRSPTPSQLGLPTCPAFAAKASAFASPFRGRLQRPVYSSSLGPLDLRPATANTMAGSFTGPCETSWPQARCFSCSGPADQLPWAIQLAHVGGGPKSGMKPRVM